MAQYERQVKRVGVLKKALEGCARGNVYKRSPRPGLFFLLFLCLLSFCFIWMFINPFDLRYYGFSLLHSAGSSQIEPFTTPNASSICSLVPNDTICCDRSSHRTDICFMKGDVRTRSASSSVFLYTPNNPAPFQEQQQQIQKIRPYTRKWETNIMNTIQELNLVLAHQNPGTHHKCDIYHDVPAVFFSTGGYTGNLYHEFNDGLLPLYITSRRFKKRVVFVILEYRNWWFNKYKDILSQLSDYPPINFDGDKRTHCFPHAIVGLRFHGELSVDSALMQEEEGSIGDFRNLLDRAYQPRIKTIVEEEKRTRQQQPLLFHNSKPKLVILSRNGSRSITNEFKLVKMAEQIGFQVEILKPDRTTELAKIYRALNSSDVMIGVHGAAMTHLLFMRAASGFVQIIPLGSMWAAATYYGEPAVKLGLDYVGYEIVGKESSLYSEYEEDDPVLKDPRSVVKRGWEYTKRVYLDNQTVELDLQRFKKTLLRVYDRVSRRGPETT